MSDLFGKLETDVEIKAPADKFHEIWKGRPHHISNINPDRIQGVELHEGEWGKEGSVIYWNYVHDGKASVAKEIVEAIDEENNSVTFKVIEGDLLEHFKSIKLTVQATPKGEGSVVHWTIIYEKKHGDITDPHTLLQLGVDLSKDIEAHLVQA